MHLFWPIWSPLVHILGSQSLIVHPRANRPFIIALLYVQYTHSYLQYLFMVPRVPGYEVVLYPGYGKYGHYPTTLPASFFSYTQLPIWLVLHVVGPESALHWAKK